MGKLHPTAFVKSSHTHSRCTLLKEHRSLIIIISQDGHMTMEEMFYTFGFFDNFMDNIWPTRHKVARHKVRYTNLPITHINWHEKRGKVSTNI